jgi:hypothetical protein
LRALNPARTSSSKTPACEATNLHPARGAGFFALGLECLVWNAFLKVRSKVATFRMPQKQDKKSVLCSPVSLPSKTNHARYDTGHGVFSDPDDQIISSGRSYQ